MGHKLTSACKDPSLINTDFLVLNAGVRAVIREIVTENVSEHEDVTDANT